MSGIWMLIRRALKIERADLRLRPHREFTVAMGYGEAFARTRVAIERAIGANVYRADESSGTIEAAFGLVNHERLIVTLEAQGEEATRVAVEAYYPAGMKRPGRSQAVEMLADAIESGVGP